MQKEKFKLEEVIRSLYRKGVKITLDKPMKYLSKRLKAEVNVPINTIDITDAHDLGKGSWAKLDFLKTKRFALMGLETYKVSA